MISPFTKRKNYTKARQSTRLEKNILRAKRDVYRLVMCNFKQQPIRYYQNPVWATLTYPDSAYSKSSNRKAHIQDMEEYFRLLRQQYGNQIKYLAVIELTQKGNDHFHVLIFNMPKYNSIKDLAQTWIDLNAGQGRECSHGAQELERLPWGYKNARKTAQDIAGYLSKYMTKAFQDLQMSHTKIYLPSKGLEKPVTLTSLPEVQRLLEEAVASLYFITYTSPERDLPYVGTIFTQVLEPCT